MELLQGFEKVSLNNNAPAVSVSNYGLTFNKAVVDTMRGPDYIDLLLDEKGKRIAIRPSNEETSIPFCINKSNIVNARINNKEFSRKLFSIMGWEYRPTSYKVSGEWYSEEQAFIFELNSAVENPSVVKDESKV